MCVWWWGGTDSKRAGLGGEQGRDLRDGEIAGRKEPGTRSKEQEPGAGSRESGARSRGGGEKGELSGLLQPKLGERCGEGGAERGAGAVRTQGSERGSQWRGSESGPRKSRLRGRGYAVLALPPPPIPGASPGPGGGRGEGKRGSSKEGGLCRRSTPRPWPKAGKD